MAEFSLSRRLDFVHAKVLKWNFDIQFPGNGLDFGIIENDFKALKSDAFRFKFYSLGSKILKISEFILVIV